MSLREKFNSHRKAQERTVVDAIAKWRNVDEDGPAIETVKHQASLSLNGWQVGRAIRRLERQRLVIVTKPGPETPYGSIIGKRVKLTSGRGAS